ncbi:MAG: CPBP family intramembrane metalloprotease [Rhodoferax sp.]|jgi:membrane protease YdiL (CAAX protease family)|nr:CPBP family intramembrane metalloprotease [Rhodoferax sp.]
MGFIFYNQMPINTFIRLVIIAISADVALRIVRLIIYSKNSIFNWCLLENTVFDFGASIISDAIFLVIIGPLVEELIFRYFGFKIIRYMLPKITISNLIFITSFAFTLSHNQYWSDEINWSALTGIFLYGLLYGRIYAARGKLLDSFVLHSVANLIVMLSTNDLIFQGNYCVQLNGWVGWVGLSLVLVLATYATLALVHGLRDLAKQEIQEMQPAPKPLDED